MPLHAKKTDLWSLQVKDIVSAAGKERVSKAKLIGLRGFQKDVRANSSK